jgi:hypothetical protein
MSLPNKTKSYTVRIFYSKSSTYGGKVVRLTRGGLTGVPDKKEVISYRNNSISDGGMNCKKSADAIVT